MAKAFSVVMFQCRHMFHKECLPSSGAVSVNKCLKWVYKIRINWILHSFIHIYIYIYKLISTFPHWDPSFPLYHYRFLESSFVTSAVRRDGDQEVEYLRWKSNEDLCTWNAVTGIWIMSLCRFVPATFCVSINKYHFSSVTGCYSYKKHKAFRSDFLCIFKPDNC